MLSCLRNTPHVPYYVHTDMLINVTAQRLLRATVLCKESMYYARRLNGEHVS